jgi:hypothetical protein
MSGWREGGFGRVRDTGGSTEDGGTAATGGFGRKAGGGQGGVAGARQRGTGFRTGAVIGGENQRLALIRISYFFVSSVPLSRSFMGVMCEHRLREMQRPLQRFAEGARQRT